MPFNLGPAELIIILVIALLVLGPGKLPDVGAALGKSIREFRKATSDIQDGINPTSIPPQAASAQQPPATAAQEPPAAPAPNTLGSASAPNTLSTPDDPGAPKA